MEVTWIVKSLLSTLIKPEQGVAHSEYNSAEDAPRVQSQPAAPGWGEERACSYIARATGHRQFGWTLTT